MTAAGFTLPVETRSDHVGRQLALAVHLVSQNFQAKYRRASLGIIWVWAEPLVRMFVFVLVFEKALGIRSSEGNTSTYIFVGILVMRATNQGLNSGTTSPATSSALVHQPGVDRRILPLVSVANAFVDFLFAVPIIGLLVVISGESLPFNTFLLFVPITLLHLSLILGVTYSTSAANLRLRDVELLVQTAATALFYLTPTIWDPANIPEEYQWIAEVNPLAPIVMSQRDVLAWGNMPEWGDLAWVLALTIILFAVGWKVYSKAAPTMADHL